MFPMKSMSHGKFLTKLCREELSREDTDTDHSKMLSVAGIEVDKILPHKSLKFFINMHLKAVQNTDPQKE